MGDVHVPSQIIVNSFGRDLLLVITGGTLGLITQLAAFIVRRRKRRGDFRSALLAEIRWANALDEWVEEYRPVGGQRLQPHFTSIPRDVYCNNTNQLGLLTEDERVAVIQYYTQAELVVENNKNLNQLTAQGDAKPDMVDPVYESVQTLVERRDQAIMELEAQEDRGI